MESGLTELNLAIAWHGRLMVLAWVILFPLGVLVARFFKTLPGQNWPHECDNNFWWYSHLGLQIAGGVSVMGAVALILYAPFDAARSSWVHRTFGWIVVALCIGQFVSGLLRGSKGGPSAPAADGSFAGDHYDMTRRRCLFEFYHKVNGYGVIGLSLVTVTTGLFTAKAPNWMLPIIVVWWVACVCAFIIFQRRGYFMDSYRAIWGFSADERASAQVLDQKDTQTGAPADSQHLFK